MGKHLENLIEGVTEEVRVMQSFMDTHPDVDCEDIANLILFLTDFGDALSPEFKELVVAAEELCGAEDEEFVPEKSREELEEHKKRFDNAVKAVMMVAIRNYAKKREVFWERHPDCFGED